MNYRSTQPRRGPQELAAVQGGYFTAKQAAIVDYGKRHLDYHLKCNNVQRVGHGLYRLPTITTSEHDDLTRVSPWSRNRDDVPQAVISHKSALGVHGLAPPWVGIASQALVSPYPSLRRGVRMKMDRTWKDRVRSLRNEIVALCFACRHPLTPWYAKALAICVVAYFFSPLDLIPDPIPIIGHLDDLVLVPLGILLVCRLIPAPVLADCRSRAAESVSMKCRGRWLAAIVILVCWITVAWWVARWTWYVVMA